MSWSKWAFRAYCRLWITNKEKYSSFDEIKQILNIDERSIAVILSDLNKHGWVESKPNPANPRTKLYRTKPPIEAIKDIAKDWDLSIQKTTESK